VPAQVLLLDSDNLPLANPEALFETQEYRQHGALFFPDWCARAPTLLPSRSAQHAAHPDNC
jgi:phenolic acid decarboxylase